MNDPIAEISWRDAFLLGYGPMDDTYREFVEVVAAMQRASDADFAARLDGFARHAEAHFEAEDRWMRETGFPPRDCHIAEHAAVLASTEQVRERVLLGDVALGRDFAAELARWFPGHADFLDSALAHWMVKRAHGGKPIVLRRGASRGQASGTER